MVDIHVTEFPIHLGGPGFRRGSHAKLGRYRSQIPWWTEVAGSIHLSWCAFDSRFNIVFSCVFHCIFSILMLFIFVYLCLSLGYIFCDSHMLRQIVSSQVDSDQLRPKVQSIIEKRGVQKKFPLFTAIYKAVTKEITPEEVFKCIGIGAWCEPRLMICRVKHGENRSVPKIDNE